MPTQHPRQLYQCETLAMQTAWVRSALLAGRVLSDSGLWLGGVDRPAEVIETLRAEGLLVVTTTKRVVDAADEAHDDLAWTLSAQA
jgi:hypothetical protein